MIFFQRIGASVLYVRLMDGYSLCVCGALGTYLP